MTAFDAAILTGGASSRMGRDKALVEVDGMPLVLRVATALSEAASITAIGGDLVALSQLGLEAVPDDHPGEGPLPALAQAAAFGSEDVVVVLACDMPFVNGATVRALVEAVGAHDAAVAVTDGHRQPLLAAWRRTVLVGPHDARSPMQLLDQLAVAEVEVAPDTARDLDAPEDLDGI